MIYHSLLYTPLSSSLLFIAHLSQKKQPKDYCRQSTQFSLGYIYRADLQSKCNKVKLTHRTSGKMGLNKEIQ